MNPIESEYLAILEALAAGVTPTQRATKELAALGLVDEIDGVPVMTPVARLRLEQLRTLVRAVDISSLSTAALPSDS